MPKKSFLTEYGSFEFTIYYFLLTNQETVFSFEAVFDREVWMDLDGIISGL